jgi:hypothetical protein
MSEEHAIADRSSQIADRIDDRDVQSKTENIRGMMRRNEKSDVKSRITACLACHR